MVTKVKKTKTRKTKKASVKAIRSKTYKPKSKSRSDKMKTIMNNARKRREQGESSSNALSNAWADYRKSHPGGK